MKNVALFLGILLLPLAGCSLIKGTSKYGLTSGVYKIKTPEGKREKRFVLVTEDTFKVFRVMAAAPKLVIDTAQASILVLPAEARGRQIPQQLFRINTPDVDFLAILFKYRPAAKDTHRQLNTNFNAAFYVGYRSDFYQVRYPEMPVPVRIRDVTHYGYSFGVFSGLGATAVNPWVTQNAVTSEYDGLVWVNGVSGIVGINNFTLGLGLGFDNLVDENKDVWIYQHKLWLGLTLGINLN